ncbi:MAG: EAL domain-containing protein [Xanthobacteraceae bacterium]|nr:EAL domain-containing protein [Xanthobacteraceae bacterium]
MRSPTRTWKIFAIVVGIVAAGVPVLAFNWWVKSHGEDEASLTAAWALGHAEAQIGQVISAIQDLSSRGVDNCRPQNIEAMRRAALQTGPVKEFALIGANSQIVCTDTGAQARPQVIVTMATADRDFMLDLVRVSDERFVRVRKMGHLDKPAIAALVPASLLLPQVSIHGGPLNGSVRLIFANGAQIGEVGPSQGGASEQHYARQRSQAYGISAAVTLPHNGLIASHDSLNRVGVVVTGMIAIVILLFTFVILVRKRPRKPIANLVRAILADEFVPFYQPVVDIQTGKLLSAEVLVRWRKPNGTILEPAAFAELVETSGLSVDLTRSLMRRVREEIGLAIGKRPHMTVAFNVAPEHFDDALIVNDVGTIFDSSPVKLTQVGLELTERSRIENLSGMRDTVAALQEKGCKVAIDDMGNDHCGLSYVLKLGVDVIKIDKSIVQSIDTKSEAKATIETLIELARNMGMAIVAEGVESFDQVTYLRDRGIAAAQGYVFAPPLPSSSFLQLLDAMDPVAEAAVPEPAKPETAKPEPAKPETAKPETAKPATAPAKAAPAKPAVDPAAPAKVALAKPAPVQPAKPAPAKAPAGIAPKTPPLLPARAAAG